MAHLSFRSAASAATYVCSRSFCMTLDELLEEDSSEAALLEETSSEDAMAHIAFEVSYLEELDRSCHQAWLEGETL